MDSGAKTNIRPLLALCVLPLALLLAGWALRTATGPYFLGGNQDPSYAYLLNSLNIVNGRAPAHFDHPGTTVQLLGGGTLWLKWRLSGASDPLNQSVLADPEGYLHAISTSLMLVVCLMHFLAGWWLYRNTRLLAPALVLQLGVFCFPQLLVALASVNPEPLLLACGLLLLPALVATPAGEEERRGALTGAVLGVGIASKITFVPLLGLIFLFRSFKGRCAALLGSLVAFLLCTIPIQKHYLQFYQWMKALLLHKGHYGQGEPGVADPAAVAGNLVELAVAEPFLILSLGFYLALLLFFSRQEKAPLRLLLVASLIIAAQLAVTAKHPAGHYLLPSMVLCVLVNAALFLWAKETGKRRLVGVMAALLVLGSVLSATEVRGRLLLWEHNAAAEQEFHRVASGAGGYLVPHYRSSDLRYALSFGNGFAGGFFSEELQRLYPDSLFYDMWRERFYSFNGTETERTQQMLRTGRSVFVSGLPLSRLPSGGELTLRPVLVKGGVALYQLGTHK